MIKYISNFNKFVNENKKLAVEGFNALQKKAEEEGLLHINNRIPIFPRPGLIEQNQLNKIASDAEMILQILTTLPERIFNGDIRHMCSYLGLSEKHYDLIMQTYGDNEELMSRCDMFFEGTSSYKFLEFNVDSSVGGMEIASVNRAMENIRFYQEWNSNKEWKFDDPLMNFVEVINDIVNKKKKNTHSTTIAVIDWHTYIDGYLWSLSLIKEYLNKQGYNVIICNQKEIDVIDGWLYFEDQRIDIVYRVFLSDDALENPDELSSLFEAYKKGNLILISGVHTELYSNKVTFALLSDPFYEHFYLEDELEIIHRCIPWTRVLEDKKTIFAKKEIDLFPFLLKNKDNFVLKPALGYGGKDIILGWKYSQEEWSRTLNYIIQSDKRYIVQEKIMPMVEKMPVVDNDKINIEDVIMNWGLYVFNGRFSGSMLRGLTNKDHGVINTAQGASMTCVFYKRE